MRPCSLKRKTSTFGDSMPQVNILRNLPTERTSMVMSPLSLGVGYGSVGPPENVNSSYVLPFKTGVGQPIALHVEEWIILRSAPCVINKKRPFSTFLLNVFSQDRFGLPSCRHWRLEEQHRTTTDTHLPIGWPKLFVTLKRRAEKE
jgi:hypothetical protein